MKLRWMSLLMAVTLALGLSVFVASASSGATQAAAPRLGGTRPAAPPPVPSSAVALGSPSAQTVLHLDVTLKVRDPAALTTFIQQLSDRSSPRFHQFLRRGQFGPKFGATLAQVAAVDAALRAEGMSPGPVTSNRLVIPVTTSAAVAERAFGVALTSYRLPGGRIAYSNSRAPQLPAAMAQYVQGVVGLSTLYRPESMAVRAVAPRGHPTGVGSLSGDRMLAAAAAGPQPCKAASNAATKNGSLTANEFASYYAMSPLYQLGDLGQGVHVALAEFEPNLTSDISDYESCYGIKTAVTYTKVDGGAGTGAGDGEAALDIEDVMGLAPDVTIDVYQAPNGGSTDTLDLYNAIVTADHDQVISTSWGLCELDSESSLISSEQTVFEAAATQGQTVLASAGDNGSTGCYGDGSTNGANLSVSDPSSQPYVVGVGGTSIGASAETVWNDSGSTLGAGGGGLSEYWCMPSYQDQSSIPGLINSDSATNAGCPAATPYVRQVPDVAADADPETGYTIFHSGGWIAVGGTSAAAPLWAAVAALTDASPFCKYYAAGDAGARPPGLYTIAAGAESYIYTDHEVFYDVTKGNNDYTPSTYTGGLYSATTGYDMATGLGTPLAVGIASGKFSAFYPGLTALMCFAYGTKLTTTKITKISPNAGPALKREKVTITGTGFLPIAGADEVTFGKTVLVATCPTTTKCTVTLPALKPSTITILASAEDLTLSAGTAASRYRVVAAPAVSSVSPARGQPHGGTTVTIRGSNFVNVTAVHFGSKKATHIRVISATKITVTVPAGSGTVSVTVTAAGGTSRVSKNSHYRY
jgi:subtilase family serine protease